MTAHIVWDWAADCSRLDLWSWGGKGLVSKTAARPTDNECSSVTQLSDTGVGDELTVVGQVTQGEFVERSRSGLEDYFAALCMCSKY